MLIHFFRDETELVGENGQIYKGRLEDQQYREVCSKISQKYLSLFFIPSNLLFKEKTTIHRRKERKRLDETRKKIKLLPH